MRIPTLLIAALLSTACGGASGPILPVTLSGRLTIVVDTSEAFSEAPDREPNDSLATARLARVAPAGRLDAARDRIDVFRYVADRSGPLCARLVSDEVEGEVVLFDLERQTRGRTLDLRPGSVYDVIVAARRGAGRYRVLLEERELSGAAELPQGYLPGEDLLAAPGLVVAPAPGRRAAELARAAGLDLVRGDDRLCLLRTPAEEPAGLSGLLARCARLEAGGWARYAEPNYLRRLAGLPDDPLVGQQWSLDLIRATAAWEHATGSTGVVVGVVDSGALYDHPDLVGRFLAGYDFVDDDPDPSDYQSPTAHGTAVASLIAAATDNAEGMAGVNWDARILPVRAFDETGHGATFDIAQAIRYAAGLDNSSEQLPLEPARVLNLSFASSQRSNVEEEACAAARAAGAVLVAAAGNDSSPSPRYPAAYPGVIAVSAVRRDGALASYSNYGSWIDLAAPGGDGAEPLLAARVTGYGPVVGSSFAVSHVSGVAALLLSVRSFGGEELEALLFATARDAGETGPDDEFGHGIVDAYGAVLATLGLSPPPLVPFERVEVRLLDWPTLDVAHRTTTSEQEGLLWSLPDIPPGWYVLEAGTDRDLDGEISDPGELYGRWRDPGGDQLVRVAADLEGSALDFPIRSR